MKQINQTTMSESSSSFIALFFCFHTESKRPSESQQDLDDLTVLKSLADGQKTKESTDVPSKKDTQYVPDESDSTKSRRLAEDYDSTKNGMDYGKYQGTHTCHHMLKLTQSWHCLWSKLL